MTTVTTEDGPMMPGVDPPLTTMTMTTALLPPTAARVANLAEADPREESPADAERVEEDAAAPHRVTTMILTRTKLDIGSTTQHRVAVAAAPPALGMEARAASLDQAVEAREPRVDQVVEAREPSLGQAVEARVESLVDAARVEEDAAVLARRRPVLMGTGPTVTAAATADTNLGTEDMAVTLVTTADTGVDTVGPPPPPPVHRLPLMMMTTMAPREARVDHTVEAREASLVDAARAEEDAAAAPRPLRRPALMDPSTTQRTDGMADGATTAKVGLDTPMTTMMMMMTPPAPTIAREASLDLAEDPRVARPVDVANLAEDAPAVPQLMTTTTMIRHTPCLCQDGVETTTEDGTREDGEDTMEDGIHQAETTHGLEDGLGRPCGRMMMTRAAHQATASLARVEARVARVDVRPQSEV